MITRILTQSLPPILLALLLAPSAATGDVPPDQPIGPSGAGDAVGTVKAWPCWQKRPWKHAN